MLKKWLFILLLSFPLVSCNQNIRNESLPISGSKSSQINNNSDSVKSPQAVESLRPMSQSLPSTSSEVTVAEAARLDTSQVQTLIFLAEQGKQKESGRDFRIIVPTYIPPGFSLSSVSTRAEGKVTSPSYRIEYRNPDSSTCFEVEGSSGGWGSGPAGNQAIQVFSEALGIVSLDASESDHASSSYIKLLRVPQFINGVGYSFNSPGNGENCKNSITAQESVKVVESLQYISSSSTKAKPLEAIQKDAETLLNKFNFPLNSCGDSTSPPNTRWYPVFMDGVWTKDNYNGGQEYCKDAVVREKIGKFGQIGKVQVGSFTSQASASELAKAVGGRVGKQDE